MGSGWWRNKMPHPPEVNSGQALKGEIIEKLSVNRVAFFMGKSTEQSIVPANCFYFTQMRICLGGSFPSPGRSLQKTFLN